MAPMQVCVWSLCPPPVAWGIVGGREGDGKVSSMATGVVKAAAFYKPFSAGPGRSCLPEIIGWDRLIPLPSPLLLSSPTPKTTNLSSSK